MQDGGDHHGVRHHRYGQSGLRSRRHRRQARTQSPQSPPSLMKGRKGIQVGAWRRKERNAAGRGRIAAAAGGIVVPAVRTSAAAVWRKEDARSEICRRKVKCRIWAAARRAGGERPRRRCLIQIYSGLE
ncbi:unnamed protein product [Urochloa humidicola]